jgi:DMSO/TMAO reductase YedYZ molybdopterin-dependent catalytic subunit
MSSLTIAGNVENPLELAYEQLALLPKEFQIVDVSRFDSKRQGDAVSLAALIALAKPRPGVRYLGLHSSTDDFHASIPLEPIVDRAFLIYSAGGQPLNQKAGGPFRFYIPNHKACHTDEIDECANVKFVDRVEFTIEKGFDNRPHDEAEHEELHAKENG